MSEIAIEPEAGEPIEPQELPEVAPSEVDRIIDEGIEREDVGA